MILPQFIFCVHNNFGRVQAMNENLLGIVAENNNTEKENVKRDIEQIAGYCCAFEGMKWDEIVSFCAARVMLESGYSDIFAD